MQNIDENWRLGLLNLQTQSDENLALASENFGVITLQRKVLDRSNISLIFVKWI